MLIYKITNKVDGKIYVGQTKKTLEQRKKNHRCRYISDNSSYHLYNAMRKYGWENFEFEVLDDTATTAEELDTLEMHYITVYNTLDQSVGYNMYNGGVTNPMDSPIVKEKHQRKMRTPETRAKISNTMKKMRREQGFSETHLQNISKSLKAGYASGKIVSPQKGVPLSQEQREGLLNALRKKVWCVNESGEIVKEFNSVYEGAYWWQENGYETAVPKHICRQMKKSYDTNVFIKGLKWYYGEVCVETIESPQ